MGAGATKTDPGPVVLRYPFKCVKYHKKSGGIMVCYGEHFTPESCITVEGPGARANLIGSKDHTICILNKGSRIHASGIIDFNRGETLLRLESGSRIEVKVNARLVIYDTLLMEEGSSLILEPGAVLEIAGPLHIAKGATVCIAAGVTFCHALNKRINIPHLTVDKPHMMVGKFNKKPVTWSDAEKSFLVDLIHFFCWRWGIHQDVILPLVLPLVCQRYGVLMTPRPYYRIPENSWHRLRFTERISPVIQAEQKLQETLKKHVLNQTK